MCMIVVASRQLSVGQVAELVGIAKRTIWQWVREGRFPPPAKFGRLSKWDEAEVMAAIKTIRRGKAWTPTTTEAN